MGDYWVDMALAVMFSVLKGSIKNAESKAKMKKAFLKLFNQIKIVYAGDPDFA